MSIVKLLASLALAFAVVGAGRPAAATPARLPADVMPLEQVRPGMTGYGLTVFEGSRPEKFNVRVVSVVPNFLPGMDVILIYCDDPRVKYAGVTAGMSGSPIYLEGKLVGALAYGWQFNKDPIAGVTPIEHMIAATRLPLRGPEHSPLSSAPTAGPQGIRGGPAVFERGEELDRVAETFGAADDAWWRRFPLPTVPRGLGSTGVARTALQRVAVPLAVSGFEPRVADDLARAFAPYGLEVLAGGAGGQMKPTGKRSPRFAPGDAIGVQLVRGDMSAAATGTVSWIDGDRVAAFGHPMLGTGETYLPVTTAHVHTFINSLARSFKLSSPVDEAGSLVQDRQACIVADTTKRAEMIPVTVTVRGGRGGEQKFHAEIARHRFLTPLLLGMTVGNALSALAPDVTDVVAEVRSTVHLAGHKPLELVDNLYSPEGLGPRTAGTIGALRTLSGLLFNPFDRVKIDRIDIGADLDYRANFAQVTGLRLTSDELEAGSRVNLQVTLQPFGKPEYVETIPLEIPRRLAGQALRIEVAAGQHVKPNLAPPINLKGFIDNLRRSYSSRTLVVTLQTPEEGALVRGKVVPDLPSSELDTLRPDSSTVRSTSFKPGTRIIHNAGRVVAGQTFIQVRVRDEVL